MRLRGLKTLRGLFRWTRARFVDHALILGYHRIASPSWDPFALCVSPQHFSEHLEVLHRCASPMPLAELLPRLGTAPLPRGSVCLTLDDGYADSLHCAKPLLHRHQIPATVFVSTGDLGREPWWDELTRILFAPSMLPDRLSLRLNGDGFEWTFASRPQSGSQRAELATTLHRHLLPLPPSRREVALLRLREWARTEPQGHLACRGLTPQEVTELADGDLLEVGAHGVSHPLLAELPVDGQRWEIEESKRQLEELIGRPVTSFSYPNGSSSEDTAQIVRESGFNCACTSISDIVGRHSDRFHLPRFWASNQDGTSFERWLRRWLR